MSESGLHMSMGTASAFGYLSQVQQDQMESFLQQIKIQQQMTENSTEETQLAAQSTIATYDAQSDETRIQGQQQGTQAWLTGMTTFGQAVNMGVQQATIADNQAKLNQLGALSKGLNSRPIPPNASADGLPPKPTPVKTPRMQALGNIPSDETHVFHPSNNADILNDPTTIRGKLTNFFSGSSGTNLEKYSPALLQEDIDSVPLNKVDMDQVKKQIKMHSEYYQGKSATAEQNIMKISGYFTGVNAMFEGAFGQMYSTFAAEKQVEQGQNKANEQQQELAGSQLAQAQKNAADAGNALIAAYNKNQDIMSTIANSNTYRG